MSGAPKVRHTLNIADSEGRPVLRPAAGNNTTGGGGGGGGGGFPATAKPASKPSAKLHPSKNPKSPSSDHEEAKAKSPPVLVAGTTKTSKSNSIPVPPALEPKTSGKVPSPSKNETSKCVGGGMLPRLGASLDSATKPSFLKVGDTVSLTASCSSSEEGSSDSSCSLAAMKKAAALELYAQRRLKIASYGRKQSAPKPVKVVPDGIPMSLPPREAKKRCGWITPQSDPLYVAFHDEEWGVPVHDDKQLFELLVLSGALAELSWPVILSKRDTYRELFSGFDPVIVANFEEKKIKSMKSNSNMMLYEGKLRGIVDNAKNILKITEEFGTFDNYCWGFVNDKPIVNNYRNSRQVPVKIPKAEVISKDLVKRGFRFVGPTIMYSFMQAVGMTNDHLVNCFRYEQCNVLTDRQQVGHCKKDNAEDASEKDVERLVAAIENTTLFQDCDKEA